MFFGKLKKTEKRLKIKKELIKETNSLTNGLIVA